MAVDLEAPVARREPHPTHIHDQTLQDDYFWLREKESPEVLDYLRAENAYTAAHLAGTEDLQAALYREMLSHIKETDTSLPVRDGDWFYYTHTVEGSQYPIHCRRHAANDHTYDAVAPEQVLLNVNTLAEGHAFMSLGGFTVSADGNLLAYSTDTTGFRQYTLHIKDLRTGEVLPDSAERVGSIVWAPDNKTLFYSVEDEGTKRQHRVYRHLLGQPQAQDALVFDEPDERFNVGVGRSRDRKYLLLECGSHTTSECHYLEADTPTANFRLIAPRIAEQEYDVDHRANLFYIRVNDTGKNFRVVTAPVNDPGRESWTEILPEQPNIPLDSFDVFQQFAVASETVDGLDRLRVFPFKNDVLQTGNEPDDAADPKLGVEDSHVSGAGLQRRPFRQPPV